MLAREDINIALYVYKRTFNFSKQNYLKNLRFESF